MNTTTATSVDALHSLSSSPTVLAFLDDRIRTSDDLAGASNLVSELESQCSDLDEALTDLNSRLVSCLDAYTSFHGSVHSLIGHVSDKLTDLESLTRDPLQSSERKERMLGEELPALAKEVARVETVRAYAETVLKLDTLVGDIEDAVASAMNKNLRRHSSAQSTEEMRNRAIEALECVEDVLSSVRKTRPKWMRLVAAVDHRVDRALAILRPQEIADHRSLLASLGWPPRLSNLTSSTIDMGESSEVSNPLLTMRGDLKARYCENFLSLCRLQELQIRRKSRQLEGYNREVAIHQPLWTVEELVNLISIACQRHFVKWTDKPEFIFALVYKITRDYVDSMDELLQPMVDEARVGGYSCREEWISAMVASLSMYLAKEIFPIYISQLDEESVTGISSQARVSWLHLIDLMIAFDKRIQSMATHSGVLLSVQEYGNQQMISSLSVFCDRPDWLDLWAEIELNDTFEKLKLEVNDERNWTTKVQGLASFSGSQDYKSPAISSAFLRHLSSVVERCRSLPTTPLRSRFLRLTGVPILHKFLDSVLLRCQEAEGLTALTDDDALIKVLNSINAAHFLDSVLMEWCEDVFFLEMVLDQGDQLETSIECDGSISAIFDEEISKFEGFRREWIEKISVVILRRFEVDCRDYLKNRKQWQEKIEEGWTASKTFVIALDTLQGKMAVVEQNLNETDFVGVWRSLAAAVDRLLFNGILMSSVKFYDGGVERLRCDLEVLFGVFGSWCLRPEGFFPRVSEGLKLLKMGERQHQTGLTGGQKWIEENRIRHLNVSETERILNGRVFKR